jgi:hypothetical protein
VKIPDRLALRFSARRSLKSALLKAVMPYSAIVLVGVACEKPPVEWKGAAQQLAMPVPGDEGSAPADAQLVLRADGSPALATIPPAPTMPADSAACPGSFRVSALSKTEIYSAWWRQRDSSHASLVASRSDDGGATWTKTVPVDTTDRGALACARPAPSIFADSTSGYVHVTYFLHSPAGPGVFFAHSMERGELYHSPVPIVYGERPSASAVSSADSVVVVAFEDPNTQQPKIAIAMSRTWGHIFSRERPDASEGAAAVERPLVAVKFPQIAIGWRGQDKNIAARVGTLRSRTN